jgi:hypothetical protein
MFLKIIVIVLSTFVVSAAFVLTALTALTALIIFFSTLHIWGSCDRWR